MGLYASLKASAAQMSTTPPSRGPLLLTECVVGDRVLAGICEAQMGEDLGIALLNGVLGFTGGSTPKTAGKVVHASTSGSLTKSCDEAVHAATPGSTYGRLRSSCAIGYYYLRPRQWTGVYASSLHSNLLQR